MQCPRAGLGSRAAVVLLWTLAELAYRVDGQSDGVVKKLQDENVQLKHIVDCLLHRNSTPCDFSILSTTTTAMPTEIIAGKHLPVKTADRAILACVVLVMATLWALPLTKPFKQCCEVQKHRVYPVITLFNLCLLGYAAYKLPSITVNDCFFAIVKLLTSVIEKTEKILLGLAALCGLAITWKLKDRLLMSLGIENPSMVIGEFRDWATCWSMKRFQPIELFIYKVESIPASKFHAPNDLYVEIDLGYNTQVRTRVHTRAGHSCVFKESMQLNFDPFDAEAMLTITVKTQDLVGASVLAQKQLNASQVHKLTKPGVNSRQLDWASTTNARTSIWAETFEELDLIPAGKLYLRFAPVPSEDTSICCCCFPKRANSDGSTALMDDI